jgi:hypothetical protein
MLSFSIFFTSKKPPTRFVLVHFGGMLTSIRTCKWFWKIKCPPRMWMFHFLKCFVSFYSLMIPNGYLYHMNKNKIKNKMSIFTLCNTLGHGHYLSRAPWLNLGWIFISIIKAICKISQLWYGITHKGPNHIEILNYLINLHSLTQSRLNSF